MPKTMPPIVVRGRRITSSAITTSGMLGAAVVTLVLFLAVWSISP